jgi:catechol 2,3-dioxygenase-like lactoylglutathione lyase family enzyme
MNTTQSGSLDISGIHHITVEVKDLDEALEFYIEILGLDELDTPENIKEARIRWIKFNDTSALHLIENIDCSPPLLAHIALKVEDLNSWEEYLENKGIKISAPKLNVYNAERFFINDPSGNRIEIIKEL